MSWTNVNYIEAVRRKIFDEYFPSFIDNGKNEKVIHIDFPYVSRETCKKNNKILYHVSRETYRKQK